MLQQIWADSPIGGGRGALHLLTALVAMWLATPVAAELGASMSISSDGRFRGRSLSEGRPVATLDLSYDDAKGVYLAESLTGIATAHSGLRILGFQENIGYARRLTSGRVIDIGITHSHYTEYSGAGYDANYAEAYLGLITKQISSHIHYSPSYFGRGYATIYADIDGVVRPLPKWRLNGHFGLLKPVNGQRSTEYDWRLGVTRQIGAFDLQLAWTGSGPTPDPYDDRRHSRDAVVFAVTCIF